MKVALSINGRRIEAEVEPRTTLLDFLRDELRLHGTHAGCEHGVCGVCTVLVGGVAVRSCLMLALQAEGEAVTTIEGLGDACDHGGLVQDAFAECHATQCGYCTAGMVLTAAAFLSLNQTPSEEDIREALAANLCRCTGYAQIVEAVALAAHRMVERNVEVGNE